MATLDAATVYRSTDLDAGSPVRMVVTLYDQAIRDLTQAAKAIDSNEIELRTREINHALMVIGQLRGTLDFDRGGEVARNLERFYLLLQSKLVEAQAKASKTLLHEQISLLLMVRDAWMEVDRAETVRPRGNPPVVPDADKTPDEAQIHGNWNA
jgi:flagellar secretion chaperone FliS